jgi:lysophospholipase L1-like esterase
VDRRSRRWFLATLAIALLVGPTQIVGAKAAQPGSAAQRSAAAAPTRGADTARGKTRRCPTLRVQARAGVVRRISIHCRIRSRARARRVNRARLRIARRPAGGRILGVNRRRNLVRYRARPGFAGRDRFVVVRRRRGVRWRLVVRLKVSAQQASRTPLACEPEAERTNYETSVRVSVSCSGNHVAPLTIAAGPFDGAVGDVRHGGDDSRRTLSATYTPKDLFVGADTLRVEARDASGRAEAAARIEVLPWRMRALGDSATAGFGFLGDGSEISTGQIGECVPPTPINDRCSSNSDGGLGYEGPTSWSADFGLANDVSWAAQFANDWQGGGHVAAPAMFQNRAVTGSTPADWLPGGALSGQLQAIVAEDPDLIAFTLGVNPLLGQILEEGKGEKCFKESEDVAALIACIQHFFEEAHVLERLQAVYTALLAAPDAEVVTFQYHLSYPLLAALAEAQPWQVEALLNHLNAQIAAAVANTRAALPAAEANRLTLVEAQVEPGDEDPLKVPRFNIGVPPNANQTWTASFECGAGGFAVDGPSHQSETTQGALPSLFESKFCPGVPWTIEADTGIHPNRVGYAQFAKALTNVAVAHDLVPALP